LRKEAARASCGRKRDTGIFVVRKTRSLKGFAIDLSARKIMRALHDVLFGAGDR
jgi:hypothetical protein